MQIAKSTIEEKAAYMLVIFLLLTGCSHATEYSRGPCPFPPADSNFPVIPNAYDCDGCYFTIEFRGEKYSFAENQFQRTPSRPVGHSSNTTILAGRAWNSFLSFFLVAPSSVEEFYNSIGVRAPLLKVDTVSKGNLNSFPPAASAAFGIYDYCEDLFEPITGDVSQSWHQLSEVELIESYPVERDSEPYQLNRFYSYGELEMTFIINNELQEATASYKIQIIMYEIVDESGFQGGSIKQ